MSACACTSTLHMCKSTCVYGDQSLLFDHSLPYILKQGFSLEPNLLIWLALLACLLCGSFVSAPWFEITCGPSHISGIYMGVRYLDFGLHICTAKELSHEPSP